jgi:transcriptional regulator with XRE-family HTH domain
MPSDRLADIFRKNVLSRMEELQMSRDDLCGKLKCTPGYLSQLLGRNPSRGPGLGALETFAKALKTSPDELLRKK